jgi:diacylglycerol kinase family enzyme
LRQHGELVQVGKIKYEKIIGVVYNPNSGKKRSIRQEIIDLFSKSNQKFKFHETKGYMDAWNYARDCNIDELSCIVAVGGDGTIHEVVNGLMVREDKKKVPLAFIPNGSGNDTCGAIGVHTIE